MSEAGTGQTAVTKRIAALRARRNELVAASGEPLEARAERALAAFERLWRERLASGWSPPVAATDDVSPFPWAMVRVSLAGLVGVPLSPLPPPLRGKGELVPVGSSLDTGLTNQSGEADKPLVAGSPFPRRGGGRGERGPSLTALLLAGNTPLLAWPALWAALRAGSAVFVKMSSRGETLWPRLFVNAVAEVDADMAALVHLDVWPGDDVRTGELARAADAVIAYGSDASVAAVRALTPPGTPFFGFGHALSVGLVLKEAAPPAPNSWGARNRTGGGVAPPSGTPRIGGGGGRLSEAAAGFAHDVLMYDQGGCLSPQAVFVEGNGKAARAFGEALARALPGAADALDVLPSGDVTRAARVRQARDLALFTPGARVLANPDDLRWAVVVFEREQAMPPPTGHGVVSVLPLANVASGFGAALGVARGRLSSVGVAGTLRPDEEATLWAEGVSRICGPGEMQSPPLDWPNGGRDLLRELRGGW